jgi:hypothetical protein
MKLRTAIKIQRVFEEPIKRNGRLRHRGIKWPYHHRQYKESARICKRHWRDQRIPYIPSDHELIERDEIRMCLLADLFIEDEEKRDEFKEAILATCERPLCKTTEIH